MEIRDEDSARLTALLTEVASKGKPWLAFSEDDGHLDSTYLHFFESAKAANDFCVGYNNTVYLGGDSFNSFDYRTMPVANLLQALTGSLNQTQLNRETIDQQLNTANVQFLGGSNEDLATSLATTGAFFPVRWTKTLQPADEISEYHVIHHQFPLGQVYETGHDVELLKSFDNYEAATNWLSDLLKDKVPARELDDYLLIGQYCDKPLQLDMEGWPESYSGLTLARTEVQYQVGEQKNTYMLANINTLDEPAMLRHFMYGRFDGDGQLKLYDDELKLTRPEDLLTSSYPSQFSYEHFNTKNSITMEINEKSYRYNQDMLIYTGFGEDMAKPLRDKMEQGLKEFTLPYQKKFGQDEVNAQLHFVTKDEKLYFNRFDMTVKQPGKEDLKQTYIVAPKYNYTITERYNMLNNRFAYRTQPRLVKVEENGQTKYKPSETETYQAWRTVNFKETDTYGNFLTKAMDWDHKRELAKHDIKEMRDEYDQRRFLSKLHRGDITEATILRGDKELKVGIAANPRLGKLDFYDEAGQKIEVANKFQQKASQAEDQNLKKGETVAEKNHKANKQQNGKKQGTKAAKSAKQNPKGKLKVA